MAKLVACVEGAGGSAALVSGWKCASKTFAKTGTAYGRVETKYVPPAGPALYTLAAVKRHLALVGNDAMPRPSLTAPAPKARKPTVSSEAASLAPHAPRTPTVGGAAAPSNASGPKPGLLHVVGYVQRTLQLDTSLSARETLSKANTLLGLAAPEGQALLEQATAILVALGVNPDTLTIVGLAG